jgi:V/A-type H+-transporting ATPase subunit E
MNENVPTKRGKAMPLETADNKVKEICAILRKETLEPAQGEAKKIVEEALKQADEIVLKAREEAVKILEEGKLELAKELRVHEGSIQLAIRQGISALRQGIEKMFSSELSSEVERVMGSQDVIANAVAVILSLIEKEGLGVNLEVMLPKHADINIICTQLVANFAEKLKKSALQVPDFKGGVEVRLKDKKMSIDLTDAAVEELLASYVIPELRAKIFTDK